MRSDDGISRADAVIIGGGFSGTMIAAQLQRLGLTPVLVEGGGRAGRGAAFSTPEEVHLLNVPAGRMSAWPDDADHFANAVADDGHEPGDFVPRWRFGAYLRGVLEKAGTEVCEAQAVGCDRDGDGWLVTLDDGSRIRARTLVLAQGNQPPQPLDAARDLPAGLFLNDPWSDEGRTAIAAVAESGGDVLIVGTGLTMVDVVLSLDAAGHQGQIVAVSRRGLAPRAHAAFEPAPVEWDELPKGSLTGLWRWLRGRGARVGWRAAVDSLRPHSQALWQGLDESEQRRFLRHARPWWDVHRHRIAPQVADVLRRLIGEGRLEIAAGRVVEMREEGGRLSVAISRRGRCPSTSLGTNGRRTFAMGVNATGPLGSIADSEDPLLGGLFEAGLARADALGIGLEIDEHSRVAGAERAWAIGPMTKGRFWEITAVPDIRGQAAAVASNIARELRPRSQGK